MDLQNIQKKIGTFYNKYDKYVLKTNLPKQDNPYIMGLGADTFIVSDGKNTFMIDGYLTRDPFRLPVEFSSKMLFATVESKFEKVEEIYKAIGCPAFSYIICTHNHFDHVFDLKALYDLDIKYNQICPKIVGTLSSVNTALGNNIPKENTICIERRKENFECIEIGDFKITFLPGKHLKLFPFYRSTYQKTPLKKLGFITAYKEGGVLDLLIEHKNMKSVLLTSSFGIGEYELEEPVGTVIQAIGGAGKENSKFVKKLYFHNEIRTNAGRVLLSHYDDFFLDFSKGLRFINVSPKLIDEMREYDKTKPVGLLKLFEKIEL